MAEAQTDQQQSEQSQGTGDATGTGQQSQGQSNSGDERQFTKAEVEQIVKDRLERDRKTTEAKAQKEREEAEAARLKEQGEFQKLAEQRQARITELETALSEVETVKAQAQRYEAALKAHLDTQRKDVPAHILALLDRMDVAEQLEYLTANRAQLVPQQTQTGATGVPGTPRPADARALSDAERERRRQIVSRQVRSSLA